MTIEPGRRAAVALALVASFMVFVDGTIVNLALPQLGTSLHADRTALEWAVNAYTLSFAAVMLGAGAITDLLGARRTFLTGLVVLGSASAVCAAAGSTTVLNLARLVQGAGSALLLPSALVLATATARDEAVRQRVVGWWAAAGGAGMAAGPLIGGVLVQLASWRAVFGINVALGLPAIAWSLRAMPAPPTRGGRRLDRLGVGTATMLIAGLVFALIEAPARGWASPAVVGAAVVAAVGAGGFVVAERSAPAPLLPVGVYADRTFAVTLAQGALLNFAFYGLLFSMSLMLQQERGLGALACGLMFLPLTALISLGNLCAAPLGQRVGRRATLAGGQAALAGTLLAVAWASTADALWPLAVALVPVGLSAGLLVPTMTSQALDAVSARTHGAAAAVFNSVRQVGGAVGVAGFGPVLAHQRDLRDGFVACAVVAASATVVALVLTAATRRGQPRAPSQSEPPARNASAAADALR